MIIKQQNPPRKKRGQHFDAAGAPGRFRPISLPASITNTLSRNQMTIGNGLPFLLLLALAPHSFAQSSIECPNEGKTEVSAAGRTSEWAKCGVSEIEFYYSVEVGGTIKVVSAGMEGAVHFKQSTPAQCKDKASSFSDSLSKCQGTAVAGQFCKSNAYPVTERIWESVNLDPCPSQSVLDWIVEFIASGGAKWPSCSPLQELTPVKHHSAQQYNCIGETFGTASGGFELVMGDPTLFVSLPIGGQDSDLMVFLAAFRGAAGSSLPESIADFELAPIQALTQFALESRTTWFESTGNVSTTRRRSLFGSIDSTGRYAFESPQIAEDAESGEAIPFIERWVRDERALYQWIPGQRRGMINPIEGGLASEYESLTYPEIDELRAWLSDPFRLLRGSMVSYSISQDMAGRKTVTQSLGNEGIFARASRTYTVEPGASRPSAMSLFDWQGRLLCEWRFSDWREFGPGILRPAKIQIETYERNAGTLSSLQILEVRGAAVGEAIELDLTPPVPPSHEWNLESQS